MSEPRCRTCGAIASERVNFVWRCPPCAARMKAASAPRPKRSRRARAERAFERWASEDNGPGAYEVGGDEERPQP